VGLQGRLHQTLEQIIIQEKIKGGERFLTT